MRQQNTKMAQEQQNHVFLSKRLCLVHYKVGDTNHILNLRFSYTEHP